VVLGLDAVVTNQNGGHVVALRLAGAEGVDVGKQRVEYLLRGFAEMGIGAGDQAIVGELLALGVHRLGDAVAEQHNQIAGLELERFLFERGVVEEPQHDAARLQPADA